MGLWRDEPRIRLDVNIWYPTLRPAKDVSFTPWNLQVALNAKAAEGHFPLIVLSHATPAERFCYHELASFLAKEGFIVIAPTHQRDCMYNMDDLFTFSQLETRILEINECIDLVLGDKELSSILDSQRIGLIGFGSGATAALIMGGATPNCNIWNKYEKEANKDDPYLSTWAKKRINAICAAMPISKNLFSNRIKAVIAVAPGFGMLFDATSFKRFYPPLLLVSAGKDKFNTPKLHSLHIARLLGNKAKFIDLPKADAGAFFSPCSSTLAQDLPELCNSVSSIERKEIFKSLSEASLAFFSHYLLITGNVPVIPKQEKTNK